MLTISASRVRSMVIVGTVYPRVLLSRLEGFLFFLTNQSTSVVNIALGVCLIESQLHAKPLGGMCNWWLKGGAPLIEVATLPGLTLT